MRPRQNPGIRYARSEAHRGRPAERVCDFGAGTSGTLQWKAFPPTADLPVPRTFMRLRILSLTLLTLGWSFVTGSATAQPNDADSLEFFETHIRPALVEHCLDCHAADTEASGNLVLNSREGWQTGGDFGPAITPGDADASLLVKVITYDDPDLQMPPDGKLDDQTIELFRKWIDRGAHDPRSASSPREAKASGLSVERAGEHWAYRPPQLASDQQHSIDDFIDAGLRDAGLRAVAPATKAQLLRRLSFDLRGLPPSLAEIQDYSNDDSPDAYESLVDRMLASPAFGETFARRWMDVARYADSITLRGFVLPQAWRYRDYLIDSYNGDRPFAQMIRDQLSGDLIAGDSSNGQSLRDRQLASAATGFLALGNTNLEDQDKTKLEFDYIDEQLETIGRAFLAQTIGCARCHDHKFDPIPTADYYAMAAIMRSTTALEHDNVSKWIERPLPVSSERRAHFAALQDERTRLAAEIKTLQRRLNPKAKLPRKTNINSLDGIVIDNDNAKFVGRWVPSNFTAGYVGHNYAHDDNQGRGDKTATFEAADIKAGRYEVRMSYTPGANRATAVKVRVFSANEAETILVNQRKTPTSDGIWVSLGVFPFEKDGQAFVMVSNEGADGHVIVDAIQFLPISENSKRGVAANGVTESSTTDQPSAEMKAKLDRLEASLKRVDGQLDQRPMVLTVTESEPVEQLAIRIRGVTAHHGKKVPRGFLTAVGNAQHWSEQIHSRGSGRAELAGWIADPDNPLTARVYVNRVWSWLMGEGLVATENNFGTTGQSPSHPGLLDHLALQFVHQGWSTKWLVRQIVTSQAYRRGPATSEHPQHASDPGNRLLWAAHLKRIPVESLRDAMLVVSGEMDRGVGGSTIRAGTKADYRYQHDSIRRSVYLPVFRNSLPPLYGVFDFADSSVSVGQRSRSTVATQSLVMMNHQWVIARADEAAEHWLESWKNRSGDASDWMRENYRRMLGREPTSGELSACLRYLELGDGQTTGDLSKESLQSLIQGLFASIDFRYLE